MIESNWNADIAGVAVRLEELITPTPVPGNAEELNHESPKTEAGEFAFRVGLPGKSGVGGGVAAVMPHKFSIAVWSPELNEKGNSVKAIKALELLTDKLSFSLF